MDISKYKFPTIEDLHGVGAHYGHSVNKWNPKMASHIYTSKQNIHVIDLEKTLEGLKKASDILYNTAKKGDQIIFVCTKKQAREYVKEYATACGAFSVTERWLGGTLTNYKVMKKNIDKLTTLKKQKEQGELEKYTKKERLLIDREIEKLEKYYSGLVGLKGVPGAVFVVDVKREKTVIKESVALDVKVVAVVDTNSDPTGVDAVIAANDDSAKSIQKILQVLSDHVKTGYEENEKNKELEAAKRAQPQKDEQVVKVTQSRGSDEGSKEEAKAEVAGKSEKEKEKATVVKKPRPAVKEKNTKKVEQTEKKTSAKVKKSKE